MDDYEAYNDVGFHEEKTVKSDYRVIPVPKFLEMQKNEEEEIKTILGISSDKARALLLYFGYNKEKMLERYTEDPEEYERRALYSEYSFCSNKYCGICFAEAERLFSLDCKHIFCTGCYSAYLRTKIVEEGQVKQLHCPAEKCALLVPESAISALVDAKTYQK